MRREKRPGIGFLNESAAHTALSWSSRLTSYRLAIPVGRLAAPTYSAVLQVGQGGVQVVHPSRPRARHKHEAQARRQEGGRSVTQYGDYDDSPARL